MKNDAGAVPEAVQILTRAIVDICHFVGGLLGAAEAGRCQSAAKSM